MKKLFSGKSFIAVVLVLLMGACSTKVCKPGSFIINEANLVKEIDVRDNRVMPVMPTSTFTTEDKAVYALITYSNLTGTHNLKWKWFNPDGKLYSATSDFPVSASSGTFIEKGSACDHLTIKGSAVASMPGKWKVNMFLDGTLVAIRPFEITKQIARRDKIDRPSNPLVNVKVENNTSHVYALVIGIRDYTDFPELDTAVKDANNIGLILKTSYGYAAQVMPDANRNEILQALWGYRKKLSGKDDLLIYFAGHGWVDPKTNEGYWIPADGRIDQKNNWISNTTISAYVRAMSAKHVLIICDGIYSDKLYRVSAVNADTEPDFDRLAEKKSRSVLCSGSLEPVDSGNSSGHSIFSSALINSLNKNIKTRGTTRLFTEIRDYIRSSFDQVPDPEYAEIKDAGHDGGEFLFIRR